MISQAFDKNNKVSVDTLYETGKFFGRLFMRQKDLKINLIIYNCYTTN